MRVSSPDSIKSSASVDEIGAPNHLLVGAHPLSIHNSPRQQLPVACAIVFFCSLVTAWLVWSASSIEIRYLENYGHFLDPAAYYYQNVESYRRFQTEGVWSAVVNQLQTNTRSPGRTLPYLLTAPDLLISPLGHLWTSVPVMWSFLVLFCFTVRRQSGSLWLACAGASVFGAIPFLYDPTLGIGAYWLDLTSALAIGIAALSLINYQRDNRLFWMALFGAFASITTLCRYSAGFYLCTFAIAALPLVLSRHFSGTGEQPWRKRILHALVPVLTALPGIVFMVRFFAENRAHYTACGYAFGASVSQSLTWTMLALNVMLSTPILAGLTSLSVAGALWALTKTTADRNNALLCAWLPLSILAFCCVIVRAVDGYHPLVYFAPALLISAFCAAPSIGHTVIQRSVAAILIALSCLSAAGSFTKFSQIATNPAPIQQLNRQAQKEMISCIIKTKAPTFVQFDDESLMPQLEAALNHRVYCTWPPKLFSVHESYLKNFYPNQSPTQAATTIYDSLRRQAALVAVFDDYKQPINSRCFDNVYTTTVASEVSRRVPEDAKNWVLVSRVNSPKGMLAIYQNKALAVRSNQQ